MRRKQTGNTRSDRYEDGICPVCHRRFGGAVGVRLHLAASHVPDSPISSHQEVAENAAQISQDSVAIPSDIQRLHDPVESQCLVDSIQVEGISQDVLQGPTVDESQGTLVVTRVANPDCSELVDSHTTSPSPPTTANPKTISAVDSSSHDSSVELDRSAAAAATSTQQPSSSTCPECLQHFHGPQGVRVHISRQHPALSQKLKMERKYQSSQKKPKGHPSDSSVTNVNNNLGNSRISDSQPAGTSRVVNDDTAPKTCPAWLQQQQQLRQPACSQSVPQTTDLQSAQPDPAVAFVEKWIQDFSPLLDSETLDTSAFDVLCTSFSTALVKALETLPGPKHPASRFYQMRKKGKPPHPGKGYKNSTNPARSRKARKQRAKAQYDYEVTQFDYYNRRKKAWRRVQNNDNDVSCKIDKNTVETHFKDLYSTPNPATRESYDPAPTAVLDATTISPADIESAMKGLDPSTAPGVDKVLLRPLKELKCARVLAVIASIMLKFSYVPKIYREGRTVLIHKGGDESDISNFRPITIFPLIRRIIERALDRRCRSSLGFSSAQRGFVSIPGTYVNTSVVNAVLQSAKKDKKDAVVVFMDIRKAFDNVGHDHLARTIEAQPLPSDIKKLLLQLMTENTIQVEVQHQKTARIEIKRGVPQGAPLSPTLFNLAVDFLLKELTEQEVTETNGYHVSEEAGFVSCVAFADDIAIMAADWESACALVDMFTSGLKEIGLEVNCRKSQVIHIVQGKLNGVFNTVEAVSRTCCIDTIPKLQPDETVRYLGVDFSDGIVLDKLAVLRSLNNTLNELVTTPLLKPDQKLNIINQFIWPSIVYPLQCAPLAQLTKDFLKDIDIAIRGSVKQILQIPMDTPDEMIYSPRKFRGLGVVRASWEAYLQHYNICKKLYHLQDAFLNATHDYDREIRDCLGILDLSYESEPYLPSKHLRKELRKRAYDAWSHMPVKGQGVIQFQEYPPSNRWIINKEGLSSSQWTNAIKMTTNCAAVRGIKGRCGETSSCRHSVFCKKTETLSHVLQDCPHGELLRNNRHHKIRDILDEQLKAQGYTVYSEVRCTDTEGRERRADLVVLAHHRNQTDGHSTTKGYILDPTVRFETTINQALEVDAEKKAIYEPTVPFFRRAYSIEQWEVIGLYVGARGTITEFLVKTLRTLGLPTSILQTISTSALRDSLGILHHHLYTPSHRQP